MRTPAVWPLLVGRVGLYIALVWVLLWAYRWTRTRSPILATVLAAGIIARAVLGALLFAISYFELPFLTSLQLGGGFWTLALDARSYFHAAASAVDLGISTIPDSSASPIYVRLLAVWMELVGVSPASAVLLNLVCYVLVAVLIVAASRSILFAAIALGAVTLSPALIIFGTQALKDSLCVLLIVLAIAGVRMWVDALNGTTTYPQKDGILGATYLSAAVFGFAGIRTYFALFIVVSVIAMAFASIVIASGRNARLKVLASYAALLPLLWVTFMTGAGAYYASYGSFVNAALRNPLRSVAELDRARAGFVAAGGATSVVAGPAADGVPPVVAGPAADGVPPVVAGPAADGVPPVVAGPAADEVPPLPFSVAEMTSDGLLARGARTVRGCAVLFVPITLLRALSLGSFTGGQGLLLITDVDTLVMDAAIIASLVFLFRKGELVGSTPVAVFALVLAALTTLSMAYVVTNFGTLFRMRLLAVTPLWVLPAFVRLRSGTHPSRPV